MPNIALLNYCNLHCPYCFANEYIEEKKQIITLEQLDYILEFCSRSKPSRIGLIGGEPTLHPQIDAIIKRVEAYCQERKTHWSIFSNGIELSKIIPYLSTKSHGGCLLNLNHPQIVGDIQWKKIMKSLNRAQLLDCLDKINLGINLYPDMIDFDYIIEVAKKYNKDSLRVSYVAPTCDYKGVDKDAYYQQAKLTFLQFAIAAKANNIQLRIDCNHVPYCYFTEEEKALMAETVTNWHNYCNPVVDISPDFKGSSCFGAYDLVDLNDFETLEEAERYFMLRKMWPLAQQNSAGKCADCDKFKNTTCQGGCLAFAKYSNFGLQVNIIPTACAVGNFLFERK